MGAQDGWTATRDEVLLRGQRRVLELIAEGRTLSDVLDVLCQCIESAVAGVHCSVLLLDRTGERVRHAAAPTLPRAYLDLIDGSPIGPSAGSCGTAAYRGAAVVVDDVASDPLWADYRDIALSFDLAACASVPIMAGPERTVLGTFAIYHRQPGPFTDAEMQLLTSMRDLAAIAIVNDRREKVLQSLQKEQSLAVLAGGIAHDFNNLLTIVSGKIGLLGAYVQGQKRLSPLVRDVEDAVERAAGLTHQLLAFAGRASPLTGSVSLNDVLEDTARLLSVTISKKVTLELDLAADLPLIEADPVQIQQVTLNLVTNASEAIGDRDGRIQVQTRTCTLDEEHIQRRLPGQPVEPGDYVTLEIKDTGCGMRPDVQSRIFEPFFTTKFSGRGLGLAALLGIVRTHRGGVEVDSIPERGTRFTVFFPLPRTALEREEDSVRPRPALVTEARTVLLVDDEDAVRDVTRGMLEYLGHEVLTAIDGKAALDVLATRAADVSVVLMDVIMPRMDGAEAVEEICKRWPDLEIVLASGYDGQHGGKLAALAERHGVRFLPKPYSLHALEEAIAPRVP